MSQIDREEAIRLVASYPGPVDKSVVRRLLTQMSAAQPELDKNDMPEQGDLAKFGVKTDETCTDCISRAAAIKAIHEVILGLFDFTDDNIEEPMTYTEVKFLHINKVIAEKIKALPTAQPEWNNHTVACLLAELFDDTCACNHNGIDEWLPKKCELLDSCPNPVGVACWEQFLKHRTERRNDG